MGLQLSSNRREFLRNAGLTLGSTLLRTPFARAANINPKKKLVVVTFGGGARDQETFAPEGQENIPNIMRELLPRATFFTQVVNRGILGHYVATASLATGVYETINNFAALPPENPTVFEYYRKDLKRPSSDAWVVAPSNGFNRIGESNHRSYGPGFGARVVLPKYLLKAAMSGSGADYQHLLRDNYENPYYTPELGNREFELQQLEMVLKLSATDFRAHAKTLSSPDELSLYIVRQLIRQVSPSFLWITMHDIDVAHAGHTRCTSRASAGPTGCAENFGRCWRANLSIRARLLWSFFLTLAGTQTKMPAGTAFSIIGRETRPHAQPG
jgi:hypothetical protein